MAVHERQLPEGGRGPEGHEHHLVSLLGCDDHLEEAIDQDEERVTTVALGETLPFL